MPTTRHWTPTRRHRFHPDPAVAPVELYQHDNGLKILVHEDHRAPVFAYHTWLAVGSRHEQPGRTGMAHLFEHLMFKETANRGPGEYDRRMERAGAHTNAATWLDWTYYYARLPAKYLDLPFELEADRLEHLRLNPATLEAEREVVLSERRMRVDDDPDGMLYEALYAEAYGPDHPYGWPTIGWEADIRAISLDDCERFYRTYYAPNNATLVVCGAVRTGDVLERVDRHYGHLAPQPIPEASWPAGPRPGRRRRELDLDVSADRLVLAFAAPALGDPAFAAAEVLLEVLFNSDSARLVRELVLDTERASDLSAWLGGFRHPGLVHVDAHAQVGVPAEDVLEGVLAGLERIAARGPEPSELAKAAVKVETDAVRERLSAGGLAHGLGHYETTVGRFEAYFEGEARVRAVNAADVMAEARRWLDGPRVECLARGHGEDEGGEDGEDEEVGA